MKARRSVAVVVVMMMTVVALAITVFAWRSEGSTSEPLHPGLSPGPPAARLLACGPHFDFDGSSYQIRSDTPFPPGAKLGSVRIKDCHDPSSHVTVSVHAYEGVDSQIAVGVRNGMTLLALAPSQCLGLRYGKLIHCLRPPR